MCDPITLTVLATTAIVTSAIGVGVSAYGNYQQTKAANSAAEYNAQLQKRNADVADMQAKDAIQRGEVEEKQFRLNVSKLKGQQRAGFGASGAVVDSGSSLDVLKDTAEFGELDALTIRHNAAVEAWGFKNQAANFTGQADLSRLQKRSAGFAAGSTLITGAGQVAGQATTYAGAGAFGGGKAA